MKTETITVRPIKKILQDILKELERLIETGEFEHHHDKGLCNIAKWALPFEEFDAFRTFLRETNHKKVLFYTHENERTSLSGLFHWKVDHDSARLKWLRRGIKNN